MHVHEQVAHRVMRSVLAYVLSAARAGEPKCYSHSLEEGACNCQDQKEEREAPVEKITFKTCLEPRRMKIEVQQTALFRQSLECQDPKL